MTHTRHKIILLKIASKSVCGIWPKSFQMSFLQAAVNAHAHLTSGARGRRPFDGDRCNVTWNTCRRYVHITQYKVHYQTDYHSWFCGYIGMVFGTPLTHVNSVYVQLSNIDNWLWAGQTMTIVTVPGVPDTHKSTNRGMCQLDTENRITTGAHSFSH